jgi:hypothetical protein
MRKTRTMPKTPINPMFCDTFVSAMREIHNDVSNPAYPVFDAFGGAPFAFSACMRARTFFWKRDLYRKVPRHGLLDT